MNTDLYIDPELTNSRILRRYLDLAKFIDLLRSQKLYLRRADLLSDKFEGAFTPSAKAALIEAYQRAGQGAGYDQLRMKLRRGSYINCWTLGPHDNMALWAIYGKSNASIAITTTVGKLKTELEKATLPGYINLYGVDYVNHWSDPRFSVLPLTNVFRYKLKAYEYEQEVRVVYSDGEVGFSTSEKPEGVYIDVCLKNLLRSVVVSPEAEEWFVELVKDLVRKYNIEVEVKTSMLAKNPD